MTDLRTELQTPEHGADVAMGLELMAIEIEEQLERAETQGRRHDEHQLTVQLAAVLHELADVADTIRPSTIRRAA